MSNRTVPAVRRRRLAYWALASILVVNAYILSIPTAVTRIPSQVEDYVSYQRGKKYYGDASIAPLVQRTPATERYFFPGPHSGIDGDGPWRSVSQWPPIPLIKNDGFEQCMTYKERYLGVVSSHMTPPMLPDFTRFLRSLVVEAEAGSGLDVYFVADTNPASGPIEYWVSKVPEEFRHRIIAFDWDELKASYPPGALTFVWTHNHITAPYFLDHPLGRRYTFAWQIERDVRLVAGSWVQFFNLFNASPIVCPAPSLSLTSVLAQLTATGEGRKALPDKGWYRQTSPHDFVVPDLVSLLGIRVSDQVDGLYEKACVKAFADPKDLRVATVQVWGTSRVMADKIDEMTRTMQNCHVEVFVPTVAAHHNLSFHSPSMPTFESADTGATTYHCCLNASAVYYRRWMDDQNMCRKGPVLIHAFREERPEEIWIPGKGPQFPPPVDHNLAGLYEKEPGRP